MNKNFFPLKTGHKASDEYFKNLAIWHNIDLVKAFFLGALISSIILFLTWKIIESLYLKLHS